jgi:hypothetical protein
MGTNLIEKKGRLTYTQGSMKNSVRILAALLVLVASCSGAGCRGPAPSGGGLPKAAIVDQLYLLEPNPSFIARATEILENSGFTVDLWQGAAVTVDFYRKLPGMGYKLILLRVHSGLLMSLEKEGAKPLDTTYLFTGENYTSTRYVRDQLTDKVSNALMYEKYPLVFAVNSAFVKSAEGRFDNTVIVLEGCESYYYEDMPAAFVAKGAAAYVGWSTVVSLEHVDKATLELLADLCNNNMTLADGISRTMAGQGQDPSFGAYLKFYPPASGNRTMAELIKGSGNEAGK